MAFSLGQLGLRAAATSDRDSTTLERAFNILAQPELRACYDSLLKDPSGSTLFPYGGFGSIVRVHRTHLFPHKPQSKMIRGSILVAGDRLRDGQTFFATRIVAFQPELQECRFHAPVRTFDFVSVR